MTKSAKPSSRLTSSEVEILASIYGVDAAGGDLVPLGPDRFPSALVGARNDAHETLSRLLETHGRRFKPDGSGGLASRVARSKAMSSALHTGDAHSRGLLAVACFHRIAWGVAACFEPARGPVRTERPEAVYLPLLTGVLRHLLDSDIVVHADELAHLLSLYLGLEQADLDTFAIVALVRLVERMGAIGTLGAALKHELTRLVGVLRNRSVDPRYYGGTAREASRVGDGNLGELMDMIDGILVARSRPEANAVENPLGRAPPMSPSDARRVAELVERLTKIHRSTAEARTLRAELRAINTRAIEAAQTAAKAAGDFRVVPVEPQIVLFTSARTVAPTAARREMVTASRRAVSVDGQAVTTKAAAPKSRRVKARVKRKP